jgi:hypothetical protein
VQAGALQTANDCRAASIDSSAPASSLPASLTTKPTLRSFSLLPGEPHQKSCWQVPQ